MTGHWQGSTRARRLPANWATEIRPRVLQRDRHRCQIQLAGCTGHATEVHHLGDDQDHTDGNLQAACHWCHSKITSAQGNAARRRVSEKRKPEKHPGLRP